MNDPILENTVDRFARRSGYRLLTYREVGLPFWDLPLKCRFLARKDLPVIDEFVLKSIDAGVDSSKSIAQFLSLPSPVVESVMSSMVSGRLLVPTRSSASDSVRYVLSERGRESLHSLQEVSPEEDVLKVPFDGLTHEFSVVDRELRWRPRDIRSLDILEIPAFPADPPTPGVAETDAVSRVLGSLGKGSLGTKTGARDLLRVIGIEGRREKFYVKALALVFESTDQAADVLVNFLVDGRPSEKHDLAFARAEGQRKLGLIGTLSAGFGEVDKLLGAALVSQRVEASDTSTVSKIADQYKAELTRITTLSSSASPEEKSTLDEMATEAAAKLDAAEAARQRIPVRLVEVHEHPAMLSDALEAANIRLLITSSLVRAQVVDVHLLDALRKLARRNVSVLIGIGPEEERTRPDDRKAVDALTDLAKEEANIVFRRLPSVDTKALIVDNEYAVVSNFDWLSYRGHSRRPVRDERGTIVTVEAEVDRLWVAFEEQLQPTSTTA